MKTIRPLYKTHSLQQNVFDDFDRFFANVFEGPKGMSNLKLSCDVQETDTYFLFSFDLPGLDEKDIKVELNEGVLSVSGERSDESVDESSYKWRGRHFGRFSQSFKLPQNLDTEAIEADYTNGVLKVLLPKTKERQSTRIEVKSKSGGFLQSLLKPRSQAS